MPPHQDVIDRKSLRIRISGLSNGLHDYKFSLDPSILGLDGNFHSPVEIQAHLDKTARQILLKAEIQTSGEFQCDRCLDEFQQPLTAAFNLVYLYDKAEAEKYEEDEVLFITSDTVYIDPSDDVRQMIMLSVPLKLLCREECKGLCPHCGGNLNNVKCACEDTTTDPRWDTLQGLIDH
jgi:uncharacterized protein